MNIYMTAGTFDFLKRMENMYPNEKMVTMINENGALLLHETMGKTKFNQPRRYEVFESVGEIKKEGLAVMNHVSVTDEGRPVFEHQCKGEAGNLKSTPGLMALRLLRPLSTNTYVFLTVWETEVYYQGWQNSTSFFKIDQNNIIGSQQKVFTSAPYVSKYSITE
ncbi:antibiotic biosynthesis monooxygenase family protein [Neobacillus sp. 19]|uniref:antibiotic biosynthesis monooxygenase family protein n=1 Tax=Neobacillus sp. 19 TaxID=3394458 RepID=UPI003BF73973